MSEPLSDERLTEIRKNHGRGSLQGIHIERRDLLAEVDRLRAQLDRLQKVLLAEWEKDAKTYNQLITHIGGQP